MLGHALYALACLSGTWMCCGAPTRLAPVDHGWLGRHSSFAFAAYFQLSHPFCSCPSSPPTGPSFVHMLVHHCRLRTACQLPISCSMCTHMVWPLGGARGPKHDGFTHAQFSLAITANLPGMPRMGINAGHCPEASLRPFVTCRLALELCWRRTMLAVKCSSYHPAAACRSHAAERSAWTP